MTKNTRDLSSQNALALGLLKARFIQEYELLPPTQKSLGPYTIVRPMAKGSASELFLARKPGSAELYAIKCLRQGDRRSWRMFQREMTILNRLNHPGIVQVLDVRCHERDAFFVMPYHGERTLSAHSCCEGELLSILAEVAKACHCAHALGIVHRDLKPENILITPAGPILCDFGVAKLTYELSSLTQEGFLVGTLPYMSPEQIGGGVVDARADVFALGVILYEKLTCRHPFSKEDLLRARATSTLNPHPPSLYNKASSSALDALVLKALQWQAQERFQSAIALSENLARLSKDYPARGSRCVQH